MLQGEQRSSVWGLTMTKDKTLQPLVSCIMPTYNRREFVPLAIQYFLRQDYAERELIIVDDGTDRIEDLLPNDKCIRYYRLSDKITLGAKLNLACEYARGTIIAHWDDDDWYATRRLSYQVEDLLHEGADVCGINKLLYYDLRTGKAYQYIYPTDQRVWLLGSSLCYKKDLWLGNRFKEIDVGVDGLFVWAISPERIVVHSDSTFAVFMIHKHNVSPKKTDGAWWKSCPTENIRSIVGTDWNAYGNNHSSRIDTTNDVTDAVLDGRRKEPASPIRNIFACLVHESLECVIDLVRNLQYHDPSSIVLLYNGGTDSELLRNHFPFEKYGAVIHPSPRLIAWGSLHAFALDCMQFAMENFSFDTITIVDSDQLAVRSDYSGYLAQFLSDQSNIGMLGSSSDPQTGATRIGPAAQAWKEFELWRPFLQRFPEGEKRFVHWTFWPSTVFTKDLARDLTQFVASDKQLQDIMRVSQIWATEEVVIPTLVRLLGYKIGLNPCSYDYVKYRVSYSSYQMEDALSRLNAYWVHPIPRQYDHPFRKLIRERFNHYERPCEHSEKMTRSVGKNEHSLLLAIPILNTMKKVEGWLEVGEADLLMAACHRALGDLSHDHAIVEIGSYCGRSTVVLGSVTKAMNPKVKVYAIDPHDGNIGALDKGYCKVKPTLERFKSNIAQAELTDVVEIIQKKSFEVNWDKPISLLLIDGLHDYVNVARDFFHFESWIVDKGFVIFHDYADYYPGVKAFVNELLGSGQYQKVCCVLSMIVVQKINDRKSLAGQNM